MPRSKSFSTYDIERVFGAAKKQGVHARITLSEDGRRIAVIEMVDPSSGAPTKVDDFEGDYAREMSQAGSRLRYDRLMADANRNRRKVDPTG